MSKSVLVIDMPENCGACRLSAGDGEHLICPLVRNGVEEYTIARSEECPLRPILENNDTADKYNNGWIPVSERLPRAREVVLCCTDDGGIDTDFLCKETRVFSVADRYNKKVVAWQPLPEVYRWEAG